MLAGSNDIVDLESIYPNGFRWNFLVRFMVFCTVLDAVFVYENGMFEYQKWALHLFDCALQVFVFFVFSLFYLILSAFIRFFRDFCAL